MTGEDFNTAASDELKNIMQPRYEYNVSRYASMMMTGYIPLGLLKYLSQTEFPDYADTKAMAAAINEITCPAWNRHVPYNEGTHRLSMTLALLDPVMLEMTANGLSKEMQNLLAEHYQTLSDAFAARDIAPPAQFAPRLNS